MTLGERIATLRRCLGLSRENLAKGLGVDESTLRDWEHGKRRPLKRNMEKLDGCSSDFLPLLEMGSLSLGVNVLGGSENLLRLPAGTVVEGALLVYDLFAPENGHPVVLWLGSLVIDPYSAGVIVYYSSVTVNINEKGQLYAIRSISDYSDSLLALWTLVVTVGGSTSA